mgnify:CR=1 FL=1
MSKNDTPIILTVTIQPAAANGKRKVIVSGAPEGEMPHIVTGEFPQLHTLIDQTYVALLKRDPQVVKVKKLESAADSAKKSKSKPAKVASKKADQLDRPDDDGKPESDSDLPVIEGDIDDEPPAASNQQPVTSNQLTLELETSDNG